MRKSVRGFYSRSLLFVGVSRWRWAAVFVASTGMVMVGAHAAALAQRVESVDAGSEERANPATR